MDSKNRHWGGKPVHTASSDKRRDIIISMIPASKRILDVACGDGATLSRITAEEKHGVDINAENVRAARKHGIKAVQRDVDEGLPYREGYFDIVITEGLIQHLYSPETLVDEIARVLRPGGLYIGSMTNNYHLWHRVMYLLGKPQDSFLFRNRAWQITSSFFTLNGFRDVLSKRFEIVTCTAKPGRFSSILPSLFGWDIVWKARKLGPQERKTSL
ncbi:MAG: class I SAM-dependent methyltransferase [Candidatus Aenigmarchaeota archaeon]|nr:class I SAM-dependent methyltransferase [Candidatus Aenigmarchaeota archaeon]